MVSWMGSASARGGASSAMTGGGVSGQALRDVAWSTNPLGPIDAWPASLRAIVRAMLNTRQATCVFWGPELINLYNDGFIPLLGEKHPRAMGQRAQECWSDAWPVVGHLLADVVARGEAVLFEEMLVPIVRAGALQDVVELQLLTRLRRRRSHRRRARRRDGDDGRGGRAQATRGREERSGPRAAGAARGLHANASPDGAPQGTRAPLLARQRTLPGPRQPGRGRQDSQRGVQRGGGRLLSSPPRSRLSRREAPGARNTSVKPLPYGSLSRR
jgi:hypothetical protein